MKMKYLFVDGINKDLVSLSTKAYQMLSWKAFGFKHSKLGRL